jgi:uncharacterized protein YndB with AHSA1/START domain/GNAT superfamily N-acetyltransferase
MERTTSAADSGIIIRALRDGEEVPVCELVRRSFDRYMGNEYSPEGVEEFFRYVNPIAMATRLRSDHFVLVAEEGSAIIGMIEFRKCEHISWMFVDPGSIGRGVARLLFDEAMRIVRKDNPTVTTITAHASRFAVPMYRSLGFAIAGKESTFNGVIFVPMAMDIGTLHSEERLKSAGTIHTARVVSHSPEKVFAAFSDAATLASWWGPDGFTNAFELFEFRVGGVWKFDMIGPDGRRYPNESIFTVIEPPKRLTIHHVVPPRFTLAVELAPFDVGTRIDWIQTFEDASVAAAIEHIVVPANEQNLDRLSAVLGRR